MPRDRIVEGCAQGYGLKVEWVERNGDSRGGYESHLQEFVGVNNNWAYPSRETSLLLIGAVLSTRITHIDDWKKRTDYFPGEESTSRISEVSMADQGKNASDAVTVDYGYVVCFDDTRTCVGESRHCNMFWIVLYLSHC